MLTNNKKLRLDFIAKSNNYDTKSRLNKNTNSTYKETLKLKNLFLLKLLAPTP